MRISEKAVPLPRLLGVWPRKSLSQGGHQSRPLSQARYNYQFLLKFRHFLETEPPLANGKGKHQAKTKSSRAVSFYLSCLRSLHNMARAECNQEETGKVVIPLQPFKKGLIPAQPMTQHRVLTAAQTKAIAAVQLRQGSQAELARDVFMLSLAMNACGFDFDTVHQALNHARRGADRVTGIYVKRDFTKAWEANRKVLDTLI